MISQLNRVLNRETPLKISLSQRPLRESLLGWIQVTNLCRMVSWDLLFSSISKVIKMNGLTRKRQKHLTLGKRELKATNRKLIKMKTPSFGKRRWRIKNNSVLIKGKRLMNRWVNCTRAHQRTWCFHIWWRGIWLSLSRKWIIKNCKIN